MTFGKAEPDSGVEVKPVSGLPETGRAGWAGWAGTRVRPVLLRLVIPVGTLYRPGQRGRRGQRGKRFSLVLPGLAGAPAVAVPGRKDIVPDGDEATGQ